MDKKDKFFSVIDTELERFREEYKSALSGDTHSVMDFVNYIIKSEGKGMRPVLLLLSANMHGVVNDASINSAVILELTHNASLIHDDVVDEAYQRRNRFSVNALWRSKKAVLIGDYVFSKAILTAAKKSLYYVLEDVARVIEDMSLGEIEQSDATIKLDITEAIYYDVIRRKTASLMSCAARLGAISTNASSEQCQKMSEIGELIGMMFQIKDDILDFTGGDSGKMIGNDLKEKKITLPLIYALKKGDHNQSSRILKLLRKGNNISEITSYVIEKNGIVLAEKKIEAISKEAKEIIMTYPPSVYREAMIELVDFIINRNK